MSILIWLLTFVLIITCLFLILLVLVQLPKKEAGLGQAFGSGTTDALFGPGSGNMLTKLTKWTSIVFFVLVIGIWILYGHNARAKSGDLRSKLSKAEREELTPAPKPAPVATINTNMTNLTIMSGPKSTNAAPAPATNAAAPAAPKQ